MRRTLYIAAGMLVALGLVLCGTAFVMTGGNLDALTTSAPRTERREILPAVNVEEIVLTDSNRRVKLSPSDDGAIHILCFESEREYYAIERENGVLNITFRDERRWYEHIGFFNFTDKDYIEIAVPASGLQSVRLKTSNGKIEVEDMDFTGELVARTSNSAVTLSNLRAGSVTAASSNGPITLSDCESGGEITAATSNSGVEISNCAADGITASSSNGAVKILETAAAGSVTATTSNARIELRGASARELRADTSNGSVEIDRVSVEKALTLKTSNASIRGTVRGALADFSIESHTSNASNSLPESMPGGDKTLSARSSNGSIDVTFVP